ncbi:MAG: hypothetical protein ACK5OB_12940 [Pirellula sp.]
MRLRTAIGFHAALIAGLGSGGSLWAQTNNSYPMLMSLRPTAAVVGSSTEHELSARYNLAGASAVILSGEGVTGEIVPLETEKPEDKDRNDVMSSKCKLKLHCAPDALPGIRDFRIMTPHGVSTIGQVVIAREPVVSESADNDTLDKATPFAIPATLCGAMEKGEDLDFYRFSISEPTQLVFAMTAQRLQNRLHDMQTRVDPVITLRHSTGATIATSDNYMAGDPLLFAQLDRPGEYILEVRDVRYQGNADWTYAIEASTRPWPAAVHPMVLPAGSTKTVECIGFGFPPDAKASITTPMQSSSSEFAFAPILGDKPLHTVRVWNSVEPVFVEPASNPNQASVAADGTTPAPPATSQEIQLPCNIAGRIGQSTEVDRYRFTAKANERWSFEVLARRAGSQLDARIRILNATDAPLVESDDATYLRVSSADSQIENWTAPADGTYILEIRDLHGRGGPEYPYAIRASSARPHFLLEVDTDKTELAPGMASVLYIKALRRCGFDGEILLSIEGLPPGVEAQCGRILKGINDGAIWLRAANDAPMAVTNVRILGTGSSASSDGTSTTLSAMATPLQEVYLPGGGRGHYPVELHTVSIAKPMDIRKIELSTTDVSLVPGGSQRIEIAIERAPDYRGNVTLDVMLQHLEQPYGNPLPKGVTVDGSQSKTLLSAGESNGYITLKAAPDAPPLEKHLLPITVHVSINFVMKHTFSGPPLWIGVQPKP